MFCCSRCVLGLRFASPCLPIGSVLGVSSPPSLDFFVIFLRVGQFFVVFGGFGCCCFPFRCPCFFNVIVVMGHRMTKNMLKNQRFRQNGEGRKGPRGPEGPQDTQTSKRANKTTNKQTHRQQRNKQTHKHTNTQTHRHTNKHTNTKHPNTNNAQF